MLSRAGQRSHLVIANPFDTNVRGHGAPCAHIALAGTNECFINFSPDFKPREDHLVPLTRLVNHSSRDMDSTDRFAYVEYRRFTVSANGGLDDELNGFADSHEKVVRPNRAGEAKSVDRLSHDLRTASPDMKGSSTRNLRFMRDFAREWPDEEIWQRPVAQLLWVHNAVMVSRLCTADERLAYAVTTLKHGWLRSDLAMHIAACLLDG